MTTADIENWANRAGLATADFDIGRELRFNVIPKFLLDVGECAWTRKYGALTFAAGEREKDLPNDFFRMLDVYIGSPGPVGVSERGKLQYIGDNPIRVAIAEGNTSPGVPTGYYIAQRAETGGAPGSWKAFKLDVPTVSGCTVLYGYLIQVPFEDAATSVDLNPYIPEPLQGAVVTRLRAEIFLDRFGLADPRYETEMRKYADWLGSARMYGELGRANYAVFMT